MTAAKLPASNRVRNRSWLSTILIAGFFFVTGGPIAYAQDVRFELSIIDKGPFLAGEPIVTELKLINIAGKAVRANRPALQNEIVVGLVIEGPDKKILKYAGVYTDPWLPEEVRIEPGASVSVKLDIGGYYALSKPGRYHGYGVYPHRILPLKWQARSNEIAFEVVAPNGKFDKHFYAIRPLRNGTGDDVVTWRLFTHTTKNVTRLYGCRSGRGQPISRRTLARFGPIASEEHIFCLVDKEGLPHVLYQVDDVNNIYAYDTVRLGRTDGSLVFEPKNETDFSEARVRRIGLFKSKEGVTPSLIQETKVNGATPVEIKKPR